MVLRDRFNDIRGRLPQVFDGLIFLYVGPSEEWEGNYDIRFWNGERFADYTACEEEIFERVAANG